MSIAAPLHSIRTPRRGLPPALAFAGASVALGVVYLAAGAPTPVLALLQERWHYSSGLLTIAFAAYAVALLVALLIVGGLSDFVGRRPVIVGSLLLESVAMLAFVAAPSIGWIIAARVVQGAATGAVTSALAAAVVEQAPAARKRLATVIVSGASAAGLGLGALISGVAVQFSAAPVLVMFGSLAALVLIGLLAVAVSPETVTRQPGAFRSLRPRVFIARSARGAFARALPGFIAAWMFAALFLGLVPTIVLHVFKIDSGLTNGATAFVEPASAAVAGFVLARLGARASSILGASAVIAGAGTVVISLLLPALPLLVVGGIIGGFGFGALFAGTLQGLTPLAAAHERAELFAAIFIVAYLAFGIPAIVVGQLAAPFGLLTTVVGFAAVVGALALIGLIAQAVSPKRVA